MGKAVVVYHSYYGCETGCCGHRVYMGDDAAEVSEDYGDEGEFLFEHPWSGDKLEWAKRLVTETFGAEHVADLDWDHCIVRDDC